MHPKKRNIKRGHAVILSSLALITAFFSFLVISAEAGLDSCATSWSNFSNSGFVADYTYKGQAIRDHEATGSGDPSHGQANVPPEETDLASNATAGSNPGLKTTPFFGYYNGGDEYDPLIPSTMENDYIFFRMRISGSPEQNGNNFKQYHWNVLLDVDGDGYKEYWVDLEGNFATKDYDRLNILYDNTNNQVLDPDAAGVRVNYFRAEYSPTDNLAACGTGVSSSHTRAYPVTVIDPADTSGDYYIEIQVPMTAFNNSNGNQVLFPDSPVSFVYSTGTSNQDPLQKDWMMDLHYLSNADPITFGDIIIPQGTPIIEFTNSSLDPVSFYTIGNNIYVYVTDPRANTTGGIDTITVTVTDTTTGDDEVLTLVETGPSTGIFTNTGGAGTQLTSSESHGVDGDHNIEVHSGDSIYVSYTNPSAFTVTDHAAIIGPCETFMEFTRANGLPSNNFILTNDINTSDKVYLTVTNPAANTNPATIQTITVNLAGNDAYTMTLTETGINTGIFRNATGLNTQIEVLPVDTGDNLWEDVDGGTVTATYNYNVGGCSGTKTTTATLFVTPSGGRVYFTNSAGTQDVELYGPNQPVYLKVEDSTYTCSGPLTVTVSSPVDSDTVTLTETAAGSGVFRNTSDPLVTATYDNNSATPNDGTLAVRNGDTITVTYTDCNDGDNDSTNNNKTDTAIYNAPNLVINEVLFWPLNDPYVGDEAHYDPSTAVCQTEYIMLYNPTPLAININGYQVTDGDSFTYTLPDITLDPGDKAYISLHAPSTLPAPPLPDYIYYNNIWYLFSTTSPIFPSNELGDPNDTDSSDQVLLYNNLGQIIDYVAWSSTVTPSVDFQGDDSAAVAAGIWQDDAFVNVSGMTIGYAITRSTIGFDSNSPNDWELTTNPTLDVCNYVVTYALIIIIRYLHGKWQRNGPVGYHN